MMMDQKEDGVDEDYQFYVVEFLGNPINLPKHVCVPASWLAFRVESTQTAYLKYPVEDPSITNKRVENKECYSNEWTIYEIHMEYGTDSYLEAQSYINKISEKTKHQDVQVMEVQDGEDKTKTQDTIQTTSNAVKHETPSKIKKRFKTSQSRIPNKKTKLMRKATREYKKQCIWKASLGKPIYKRRDRKTGKLIRKNKAIIQNHGNLLKKRGALKLKTALQPVSAKSKENKTASSLSSESMDAVSNEVNSRHQSPNLVTKTPLFGVDVSEIQNLFACIDKTRIMMKEMELTCAKNSADTKEFMTFLNDAPNKNKAAVENVLQQLCKNKTENKELDDKNQDIADPHYRQNGDMKSQNGDLVEQVPISQPKVQKEMDLHEVDDSKLKCDKKDEEYKPLKQVRNKKSKSCSLTKDMIPPEYDENDSRWTLKYQNTKPHQNPYLMALVRGQGVYVDKARFQTILRMSRCPKQFARLLLEEVFTEIAISTCHLPDAKSKRLRKGYLFLDQNALNAMLMCVREQAMLKNWPFDSLKIKNSLFCKLRYERQKYVRNFKKKQ